MRRRVLGVFLERPLSEGPMCVAGMGGCWNIIMVEDGGRTRGHYNNRGLNSWGGVWFLVASMGGYWD
jgi:hypothetical protein